MADDKIRRVIRHVSTYFLWLKNRLVKFEVFDDDTKGNLGSVSEKPSRIRGRRTYKAVQETQDGEKHTRRILRRKDSEETNP